MDTAFLDTLSGEQEKAWFTTITVKDVDIRFKLDTGAEVTAITSDAYQLLEKPQLNAADKILCGPSRHPLGVVGKFKCNLATKGKVTRQEIFVVKGLKHNLLGLPAITALNLAAQIDCTLSTTNTFKERFPKVFEGLGNLGEEYVIKLKPDAKPHALYAARHVPLPLRPKVTEELNRMETMGIISRVDEPTPWCAGMVVVPKKSGAIRICVDLKPLNESVLREVHPLPIVDDTLSQLKGAKIFTKLDANSGFWQIPLSKPSRLLTTFITPAGRYCFNKLPFGISSAPEHFQKRMGHILQGLDGVLCQTDDVLIFGSNQAEHDTRVTAALERLQSAGVTLNPEKCEFSRRCLKFLGHIIDQNGIRPDPDKTAAIMQMKAPETTTELRRFLGMANQLGKFTPKLAELARPLRELLSKTATWNWGPMQDQAFARVKEELSKETTLAHYDPAAPTKISADASSYGLGAVLLQQTTSQWKPIAYASRSMSDTERRYAQIEKEALASTWACEKFATYVLGMKFILETDHKPLVPLLNSKHLDSLPPRILRFRLRLSRFDYSVQHVPGKELYTADTLSRSPLPMTGYKVLADLAEAAMDATVAHLPASEQRIDELQTAQHSDATCALVMQYCREGWPTKHEVNATIRPYWEARGELTLSRNNLLLYNSRIVIPASMQQKTLTKLYHGHQGIDRCRQRAKISVWWPGISRHVEDFVRKCQYCAKHAVPRKEPLIPSTLPDYPWQKVGTDLFVLGKDTYIVTVDYFSRYPEIVKLTSTTSQCIIAALKGIFARHGIPETVVSDNGPQYSSQEFTEFAGDYSFHHVTSSPHYPQSIGQVERTVKTVKKLLSGSNDPCLSLLAYCTTPLPWCNLSPAQLLMGRQIRSDLPQVRDKLTPQWPYLNDFRVREKEFKGKQKHDFDRRHRVKELPCLPDDTEVVVTTGGQLTPGHIVEPADAPRSHVVQTSSGVIRRNRSQLNAVPNPNSQENITPLDTQARSLLNPPQTQTRNPIRTRSRTGTPVTAPDRFSSS